MMVQKIKIVGVFVVCFFLWGAFLIEAQEEDGVNLSSVLDRARIMIEDRDDVIQRLRMEMMTLRQSLSELQNVEKMVSSGLYEKRFYGLSQQLKTKDAQIVEQDGISQELQRQYDEALVDLERLLQGKKTYYKNFSDTRKKLKELEDSLAQQIAADKAPLENKIMALEKKTHSMTVRFAEKQKIIDDLMKDLGEIRNEFTIKQEKVKDDSEMIEYLTDKISTVESRKDAVIQEKELALLESEKIRGVFEKRDEIFKRDLFSEKIRNENLVSRLENLQEKLKESQEVVISEVLEKKAPLNPKLRKVRMILNEKKATIKELTRETVRLKKEFDSMAAKNIDLDNEMSHFRMAFQKREQSISSLHRKSEVVQQELFSEQAKNENLRRRINATAKVLKAVQKSTDNEISEVKDHYKRVVEEVTDQLDVCRDSANEILQSESPFDLGVQNLLLDKKKKEQMITRLRKENEALRQDLFQATTKHTNLLGKVDGPK